MNPADRIDALEAELAQLREWADRGLGECPCCDQTLYPHNADQDGQQWRVRCHYEYEGPLADTPEAAWKAAAEEMAQ